MTTALIVILCLAIAWQSLVIFHKDKKIKALEIAEEYNMLQLKRHKQEWAEESPTSLMYRAYNKLRNDEQDPWIISTCRSYAASIMRIK